MTESPRQRLFSLLADRLMQVEPGSQNLVKCPLCLDIHTRESLSSGGLTLEHIIPSKCGSRYVTLTCKGCNNSQGTELDSHLIKLMRSRDALAGMGEIPIRIATQSGPVTANIAWRSGEELDPNVIRLVKNASHPSAIEELKNSITPDGELRLTMEFGFVRGRAYQALYRIAYLALFDEHGYSYALSKGGAWVREVVRARNCAAVPPVLEAIPSAKLTKPVLIVGLPAPTKAYVVVMRLRTAAVRHYAVVLPTSEVCEPTEIVDLARSLPAYCLRASGQPNGDVLVRFAPEAFSAWSQQAGSTSGPASNQ